MPKSMSEEQHEHIHQLIFLLGQFAEPKYEKGALEHGTNLWEYSDEELEAFEMEEIIDLVIYRLTRILKKRVSDG